MAPQTGGQSGVDASDTQKPGQGMSLEAMLEMKRQIDQKLNAMGAVSAKQEQQPATAPPPQQRSANRSRFTQKLQTFLDEKEATQDEAQVAQQKGQLYEVIFHKAVAVRMAPSLSAPFFRGLAPGSKVRLFEWDSSRSWRRATFWCAKEAQNEELVDNSLSRPDYLQQALGPSTRVRGDVDSSDVSERGNAVCEKKDGWVLIEHPQLGQLLEAVANSEDGPAKQRKAESKEDASSPGASAEKSGADANEMADAGEQTAEGGTWSWGNLNNVVDAMQWVETEAEKLDRRAFLKKEFEKEQAILDSVEERPGFDEPTLMRAVRAGSYEVAQNLLRRGADPNTPDAMGETAMVEALSSGRLDIIGLLLSRGAELERAAPGGIVAVLRMAEDARASALLKTWQGFLCDEDDLQAAVEQLNRQDAHLLAPRLGVKLKDLPDDEPPPLVCMIPGAAEHASSMPAAGEAAPLEPTSSPVRAETQDNSPPASSSSAMPSFEAEPPRSPSSPSAAPAEVKASQSPSGYNSGAATEGEPEPLQAGGKREPGVRYRVVYKKVAVRDSPDKHAKNIKAKRQDDIVEMYEWDATQCWRKVWLQECSETGKVYEIEGWMLLRSTELGTLLEEIQDDDSDDDEGAG